MDHVLHSEFDAQFNHSHQFYNPKCRHNDETNFSMRFGKMLDWTKRWQVYFFPWSAIACGLYCHAKVFVQGNLGARYYRPITSLSEKHFRQYFWSNSDSIDMRAQLPKSYMPWQSCIMPLGTWRNPKGDAQFAGNLFFSLLSLLVWCHILSFTSGSSWSWNCGAKFVLKSSRKNCTGSKLYTMLGHTIINHGSAMSCSVSPYSTLQALH